MSIVDLSDEILHTIFKKLDDFDVLYSLVGVNQRLNNVACDINFTRAVDLTTISSNEGDDVKNNAILDRFCMHILPRIHDNVECLTVQACFLQRALYAGHYLNLHKLTLVNLQLKMAFYIFKGTLVDLKNRTIICIDCIFSESSPFIHLLKYQITDLVVSIIDYISNATKMILLTGVCDRIFGLLSNLKHLELDVNGDGFFRRSLLSDLLSTKCFSSSVNYLRIKIHNFDDCLYLLDGRLSQLHMLIVKLDYIHDPVKLRLNSPRIIHNSLKIMKNMVKNYE